MKLAPGTKLGPYEILEPISAGGMGEVWKARDTRLGRIVAIKKVKEQHGERFKQEARSIAALNHPNICQIHDIGDDYLVLEYVEGKPLSSPIPEKEAVRLAIQIATALEAAHRKGIIHRDLKPGNILVTDEGSVKLLDFGLAKLYEQSAGESTAEFPATQAGTVLGTVAYMSPEQAQGQPADARSDIFSFGLVLYEMLSGRRAFSGDTPLVIGSALMKEEPPPLKASPLLEKIVSRCLAKQPSARYQSISEVKKALEQILAEKAAQPATEPQPSIAVLPFVNMSGDKEQEYFSDGLAEEIINALTQIPDLKVTSRTSAFAFRGKQQDITKIAEALHVRTILEGSVRKFGSRIRISAQLINAADGYHLWSERYDREMSDLFAIQDEISSAIAEKLRGRLSGNRTLIKRHTENAEAYNLYLKGRYHFYKFTLQSLEKGKEYYEHALAVDPNYALAWGGLSQLYKVMGFLGLKPPKESNTQSSQAALRALELDERLPIAHAMMGAMRACTFDWKGAEREFRWAMEIAPESEDVLGEYCISYLAPTRRLDEALALSRRAVDSDPLSPFLRRLCGCIYYLMRHYDHAIEECNNALELDPGNSPAYLHLGQTYIALGRFDDAIRIFETAGQSANLGFAYTKVGQISETQKIFGDLKELAKKAYVSYLSFAIIHLGLGEIDRAFDCLDKAIEEHDSSILMIPVQPLYDPLRSHPRYKALLRKMNLEP